MSRSGGGKGRPAEGAFLSINGKNTDVWSSIPEGSPGACRRLSPGSREMWGEKKQKEKRKSNHNGRSAGGGANVVPARKASSTRRTWKGDEEAHSRGFRKERERFSRCHFHVLVKSGERRFKTKTVGRSFWKDGRPSRRAQREVRKTRDGGKHQMLR